MPRKAAALALPAMIGAGLLVSTWLPATTTSCARVDTPATVTSEFGFRRN